MSTHCTFSPSASSRWLKCLASLNCPPRDQKVSEYAAEGTAAHELAQRCWMLDKDPSELRGSKVEGFSVTEEMEEAVQIYLDTIEVEAQAIRHADDERPVKVDLEKFLKWNGSADFGGTVDCLIRSENYVTVIDFKYGQWHAVEAEDNTQALCYAILAGGHLLSETNDPQIKVRIVIVQPRCRHPEGPVRSWEPSPGQIEAFYQRLRAALETPTEKRGFCAGSPCKWCPRKVDCPELHRLTVQTAAEEFDPDRMTADKAAEVMGIADAVTDYVKSVEQWSHSRMEKGTDVPGYKLVHSYGNRRFIFDEDEIVKRCRSKRIGKRQLFKASMITPAQLEKLAGKEFVSGLSERPLKGTTVVPESDRRPAVEIQSAADEFASVES